MSPLNATPVAATDLIGSAGIDPAQLLRGTPQPAHGDRESGAGTRNEECAAMKERMQQ